MALANNLSLVKDIFNAQIKQVPTRDGFGEGLVLAGEADPNVVALCADLTESTRVQAFAKKFPERFFEVGVAEQNMATIGGGLGISGKCVYIASYATFSPGRNWEQIRTTIAYNNSNVKIIGAHAGISVGPDGATHQALEDMAMMRVLPNMKVISPSDAIEARKATLAVSKFYGPAYIRLGREKTPIFTTNETPFEIGKAEIFWEGEKPQVAIVACGSLVYNALKAAQELEQEGIQAVVLNNHTIKPMDEKTVTDVAKRCGAVVTVEEHQVQGGMGSRVAEILAQNYPVPIEFIGMQDSFGESGAPAELIEKFGMGVSHIKAAVKKVIKKRV